MKTSWKKVEYSGNQLMKTMWDKAQYAGDQFLRPRAEIKWTFGKENREKILQLVGLFGIDQLLKNIVGKGEKAGKQHFLFKQP